ncbi:hypothetical protein [Clostridium sp.]|uniref:hypothetical protein n=1 Tax=Clostridium sp. TaxID=1506 RepID=UPI002FCA9B0F
MKSMISNSRQTGLAIILVGLMITIIGFGQYFEGRLKVATLIQNNIGSFKKYEALEGKVTYSLPQSWIASEKSTARQNIIYFNEFVSDDANTHGFIQIITKENEKKLIDIDIEEIKSMGITEYTVERSKVKDYNSQIIKYNLTMNNHNISKVYNYYIENHNNIIKVNFVVNSEKHKENTPVFLENIVNTFSF